jgi:hypothetical protein
VSCNHCKRENEIIGYDYGESLTFSNLALEFYNWEEFNSEFIAELGEMLGGKIRLHIMHY